MQSRSLPSQRAVLTIGARAAAACLARVAGSAKDAVQERLHGVLMQRVVQTQLQRLLWQQIRAA